MTQLARNHDIRRESLALTPSISDISSSRMFIHTNVFEDATLENNFVLLQK